MFQVNTWSKGWAFLQTPQIQPRQSAGNKVYIWEGEWVGYDDYRGVEVYSVVDDTGSIVNYIGDLIDGFVLTKPNTQYDKWNGSEWKLDLEIKRRFDIENSEILRSKLINEADSVISELKVEFDVGEISEDDLNKLKSWVVYKKRLRSIDTSALPVVWPEKPA